MKEYLKINIFSSKAAGRIFGLFILSAFIPIITISIISYYQVSDQLDEETRHQLYRESKAYGQTIYDRLVSLDTNLKILKNELQRKLDREIIARDQWLQSIFKSLVIYNVNEENDLIFGDANIAHIRDQIEFGDIGEDETTIRIVHNERRGAEIYLINGINNNSSYIVAEINQDFLWTYGIYEPNIACVLTKTIQFLYCTVPTDQNLKDGIRNKLTTASKDNSVLYWDYNDEDYVIGMWDLFLDAHFNTESITTFLAMPERTAFSEFDRYKSIFPKSIVVSVLLILMLSIFQIRKFMIPLEMLYEGTKRIASGKYDKPVDIKSGDEFENLAGSFNEMATKIDEQIKTISTMAEIDRLILSSFDTDYIINTLIVYLHNLVDANHINVITIEDREEGYAEINFNLDEEFNKICKENIYLDIEEIKELENGKEYLICNEFSSCNYLAKSKKMGDKYFIIYPVFIKNKVSGVIIFGSKNELNLNSDKLKKLGELSDRVAVALSNAEWEDKLYKQAHYDSLTLLPNRFLFRDRVERALEFSIRENEYLAILFIDLDKFKDINDSLGHVAGDEILIEVSILLKENIRSYDTLARFGGDEFAILLAGYNELNELITNLIRLSNRIVSRMRKPFLIKKRQLYITPSIGIAIYPRDGDNYDDLLKNADSAMYNAKRKGRGKYEFFERAYNVAVNERLELETELRQAFEKNQFELYYQPKINCKTNRFYSAEALLRWNHPEKGQIQPKKFIPIAEETGLIIPVDYWVLNTVCEQCKIWLDRELFDIVVSVNLSANQFRQHDLYKKIGSTIKKHSLPPRNIELEIIESVTIENFQKTIALLKKFRKLGIGLSIDDFGTGYSSMSYLQKLPISRLKIDKSFIKNLPHDNDSISIIKAIIALGHSLNLSVIAEGIETEDQFHLLIQLNCDELQGYFIGKPLPVPEFEKFMLENNFPDAGLNLTKKSG